MLTACPQPGWLLPEAQPLGTSDLLCVNPETRGADAKTFSWLRVCDSDHQDGQLGPAAGHIDTDHGPSCVLHQSA